jgi:redox-sensing transcriptional repressor
MMADSASQLSVISKQTLKRLPDYLNFLKSLDADDLPYISAPTIAKAMRLNEVQVRKDLAAVSTRAGKPKKGFLVTELIQSISSFLGYGNAKEAVLVGTGQLGRALLSYEGFEEYGINIVAAFDKLPVSSTISSKPVLTMDKLEDLCRRMHIHIGVITVPGPAAQDVCDKLVQSGILAILNFAPVHLKVPEHILVQNENMAVSLAFLSKHLKKTIEKKP